MFPGAYRGRTNKGGDELPLHVATEPLVGYRSWMVMPDRQGIGLALQSIHVPYQWGAGVNVAACNTSGSNRVEHEESSPGRKCACGFYCAKGDDSLESWDHLIQYRVHATGFVALSGRIIECTAGYKAGQAEILDPIVLETPCAGRQKNDQGFSIPCGHEVVGLGLPIPNDYRYKAVCTEHLPLLGTEPAVNVELWAQEAARILSAKYGVEVLTWFNL